jgi:hypothetical protein
MKRLLIALISLSLAGCQTSDQEIRADIASKAQQDLNFAGLQYTVDHGAVVFTGRCPSEKAFKKIKQAVANIHVIKDVSYQVTIAPVALNTLTPIKLETDSILAKYPQTLAVVDSGQIVLKGSLAGELKDQLLKDLKSKYHGMIKDSLSVQ